MVFFCTSCWSEIAENAEKCPNCGVVQEQLSGESYIKKLIRALHHPEPSTPIRASMILGELKAQEAIPDLLELITKSNDPFIIAAAIKAIGNLDYPYLINFLEQYSKKNKSIIVQDAISSVIAERK